MDTQLSTLTLKGMVPAVCDAEAGPDFGLSARQLRTLMTELCTAVRSALDDERVTAEDSLRRATEILREIGSTEVTTVEEVRGGLSPWQIRKVASFIEANLDRSIKNDELASV